MKTAIALIAVLAIALTATIAVSQFTTAQTAIKSEAEITGELQAYKDTIRYLRNQIKRLDSKDELTEHQRTKRAVYRKIEQELTKTRRDIDSKHGTAAADATYQSEQERAAAHDATQTTVASSRNPAKATYEAVEATYEAVLTEWNKYDSWGRTGRGLYHAMAIASTNLKSAKAGLHNANTATAEARQR